MKKYIFGFGLLVSFSVFTMGCSKCYECSEKQEIFDSNGNKIDETTVTEEVCSASKDEIDRREAAGATCS